MQSADSLLQISLEAITKEERPTKVRYCKMLSFREVVDSAVLKKASVNSKLHRMPLNSHFLFEGGITVDIIIHILDTVSLPLTGVSGGSQSGSQQPGLALLLTSRLSAKESNGCLIINAGLAGDGFSKQNRPLT